MKVILMQDIADQGKQGDVVNVSDGYARNYLFPRKLAVEAAGGALKNLQTKHALEDRRAEKMLQEAETDGGAAARQDRHAARPRRREQPPLRPRHRRRHRRGRPEEPGRHAGQAQGRPAGPHQGGRRVRSPDQTAPRRHRAAEGRRRRRGLTAPAVRGPRGPRTARAPVRLLRATTMQDSNGNGYSRFTRPSNRSNGGNGNGGGERPGRLCPASESSRRSSPRSARCCWSGPPSRRPPRSSNKEDFYRDSHQVLFEAITALAQRDEPVDLITVQEELKNRDKLEAVGGLAYLDRPLRHRPHRGQHRVLRQDRRGKGDPAPLDRGRPGDRRHGARRGRGHQRGH